MTAFTARSAATTAAAIASSRWRKRITASGIDRLGERVDAAIADALPVGLGAHRWHVPPAAIALHAASLSDLHAHVVRAVGCAEIQRQVRDDEQHRQLRAVLLEQ